MVNIERVRKPWSENEQRQSLEAQEIFEERDDKQWYQQRVELLA